MKNRICRLLLAFLLVLVFCVSMAAAEQTGAQLSCVTDTAGLLSESEKMLLERMAESVSQKYGVGVYIVTVEDYRTSILKASIRRPTPSTINTPWV